ncbi:MAG: sigma-70 family RNA polymerase sigma factor [Polyangiaceae bacterium]
MAEGRHAANRLSVDEEHALVESWRTTGDRAALARLVASERPMVEHLAKRFQRHGAVYEDLVQEGMIGLLEGLKRFEPGRGLRLSTYAAHWVRAMLFDYVFRQRTLVRVGYGKSRRLFFALGAERARLERAHGGPAAREVVEPLLAARFGTTVARVREVSAHLGARDMSLDAPVGDDGATRLDAFVSPDAPLDDLFDQEERAAHVRAILDRVGPTLSSRERMILEERLMTDDEDAASLAELGTRVGVTRERVRQIECRLRERLRELLAPLAEAG